MTFRKGISSPSTTSNAGKSDVDDGLYDRFSPTALSALPFPLGVTTIEASVAAAAASAAAAPAEAEAEDGPNIFGQSRIAPSLPFYRRAADGAVSLVGWRGRGADAEKEGWAGGQAFEWEWTDPSASSAASGEEDGDNPFPGVFAGWGVAPEERLRALGVGGLDGAFRDIFRRVFASRLAPSDLVAEMGLKHVRGVLLYGKEWWYMCGI